MGERIIQPLPESIANIPSTKRRGLPYIIINNISKPANIKSLLKSAAAFGSHTIFVAGQQKFEFDPSAEKSGIPPSLKTLILEGRLKIVQFDKLQECVDHVHSIGIRVIGIEIDEASFNVENTEDFFSGDTAFMMGNEGQGMNSKQLSLCDGYVKISQYGGGTASLNVSVAAAIVLHRFQQSVNFSSP